MATKPWSLDTKIKIIYVLVAYLFAFQSHAELSIEQDFKQLNTIRESAGLTIFSWNEQLANSAQNHANYLSLNNQHGHYEQQGHPLFTGQWVSERSLATHYPNRMVSENVTSKSGDSRFYNPIDSLMSAIYHRLGFLNLSNNEVGIGHQSGRINSYVYVMGNKKLTQLCQQPEFTENGAYNYKICAQSEKRIDKRLVDNAKQKSLGSNTPFIIWPVNGATDIPPVFYEESPDPLPYHSVSGYPISIQFNPAFFKSPPKITTFTLQKSTSTKPLKSITILNKDNDPNQSLNAFQHALFPSLRLEWGTKYKVNLHYTNVDTQQSKQLTWSFTSKDFNTPLITITQSGKTINVVSGQSYIFYFPPENARDTQAALKYSESNMGLKLNYIDNNTLNAYITRDGHAKISFHNKTIELTTD